mmetsp:Transcript_5949/g.11149  ORF Transcript_5949/g.11149 Transcript_5949/m.11149 type:complete len:296 (-) Transcript_5949:52-939(-)
MNQALLAAALVLSSAAVGTATANCPAEGTSSSSAEKAILLDAGLTSGWTQLPSVSLLQRTASKTPELAPVHGSSWGALRVADAKVRQQDSELRERNSQLLTELHVKASLVASAVARARRQIELKEMLQPMPMTLTACAFSVTLYWFIYLCRYVEYRRHNARVERLGQSRRDEEHLTHVDFVDSLETSYFCNFGRKTVRRLLALFVVAVAGLSYLASNGYFETLSQKYLPLLYLIIVALMILQVLIREAWTQFQDKFHVVCKVTEQLGTVIEGAGSLGMLGHSEAKKLVKKVRTPR